jgi:hypothetical protein
VPSFTLTASTAASGTVHLRLVAHGAGSHTFTLRTDNLVLADRRRRTTLDAGRDTVLEWTARIVSPDAPWTAVAIADGDAHHRREALHAAAAAGR